jgi:phosphoserine aminotransferase
MDTMTKTKRVYNFGAGPCTLPLEALEEAQKELVSFKGAGMSIIEMSHRSKEYDAVHQETLALLKEIYGAPADFDVLIVQGGATLQFSMLPMNLLAPDKKGAYVVSGTWAKKALKDAQIYANAYTAWDGKSENYTRMPSTNELKLEEGTRYLHVTSNETIGGIRFTDFPDVNVPMVADMSSDFMSRAIPWEKFDVVYGGAQKNLGPAGAAIVFIRKSVLEHTNKNVGAYLRYDIHSEKESLYNTPPVFTIHMINLVLKWVKSIGGLAAIEKRAEKRAAILYNYIDASNGYYNCPVNKANRSMMNIVFRLPSEELEAKFIAESKVAGFIGLKGHRSVGGCRASCYNALPIEGVEALVSFMDTFKKAN